MSARHDGAQPASDRPGPTMSGAEAMVEKWAGKYREAMTKFATKRLEDRDAAEDVVQQAFKRALSRARRDPGKIATIRKPLAWMLKITRNKVSDVLRTEGRRRWLRRENGDEIREILFPEPDPGSGQNLRAERVLEEAPRVLTKRQLEVFGLVWEGVKGRRDRAGAGNETGDGPVASDGRDWEASGTCFRGRGGRVSRWCSLGRRQGPARARTPTDRGVRATLNSRRRFRDNWRVPETDHLRKRRSRCTHDRTLLRPFLSSRCSWFSRLGRLCPWRARAMIRMRGAGHRPVRVSSAWHARR